MQARANPSVAALGAACYLADSGHLEVLLPFPDPPPLPSPRRHPHHATAARRLLLLEEPETAHCRPSGRRRKTASDFARTGTPPRPPPRLVAAGKGTGAEAGPASPVWLPLGEQRKRMCSVVQGSPDPVIRMRWLGCPSLLRACTAADGQRAVSLAGVDLPAHGGHSEERGRRRVSCSFQ